LEETETAYAGEGKLEEEEEGGGRRQDDIMRGGGRAV